MKSSMLVGNRRLNPTKKNLNERKKHATNGKNELERLIFRWFVRVAIK
jgi:hypothetical protein